MPIEKIKEILNRIPFFMILTAYLAWLSFDVWRFQNATDSNLAIKRSDVKTLEAKNQDLEKKIREAKEFIKNLDVKRQVLRNLSAQLNETSATLSEEMDIPAFIKMVITEAKKLGLTVLAIHPTIEKAQELYTEQRFEMQFKGVFIQLLVFLQRLANVQKIIRTDGIEIQPSASAVQGSRYAEIQGKLMLQTYKYAGAKAVEGKTGPSPGPSADFKSTPGGKP